MNFPLKNESELRGWLREVWGKERAPLMWSEAALGGTFGAPDVLVPLGGLEYLPLELKHWRIVAPNIIQVKMKRTQTRLHSALAERGARSAFLFILEAGPPRIVPASAVIRAERISNHECFSVLSAEDLVSIVRWEKFWP